MKRNSNFPQLKKPGTTLKDSIMRTRSLDLDVGPTLTPYKKFSGKPLFHISKVKEQKPKEEVEPAKIP